MTQDGHSLLSGRDDGAVDVYSLEYGRIERTVRLHDGRVDELAINPAGTLAASVAERESRMVVLFDPRTCRVTRRITLPEGVKPASAVFGPTGRWLAVGCWNGAVRVYNPQSGELLRQFIVFSGISEDVVHEFNLVVSPARQLICLLTPYYNENVDDPRVFDPESGRPLELPFPLAGVRQVTFAGSRALVATRTKSGAIVICDANSGAVQRTLSGQSGASDMAFDFTSRRLAVSGTDRMVKVWDVQTGEQVASYAGQTKYISRVFVRPTNGEVVSVSTDGTARVWATGQPGSPPWAGHTHSISDLAVSPDGRHVVTASFDGTARVWDAKTGRCIHTLRGHTGDVYAVAVSPDGRRTATGGEDRTVRFWDLETGACERVDRHEFEVGQLVFVSGEQILVNAAVTSEGPHPPAVLFDIASRQEVCRLSHPEASEQAIYQLAASRDGRVIAAGFESGDVVVWPSAGRGRPLILQGHGGDQQLRRSDDRLGRRLRLRLGPAGFSFAIQRLGGEPCLRLGRHSLCRRARP
jgi:WD40 repeat protein